MHDKARSLNATSPLNGYEKTINGTLASEVNDLCIIAISVPNRGKDNEGKKALNALLKSHWQLSFPETGSCVRATDIPLAGSKATLALLGMQSDQCLLVVEADTEANSGADSHSGSDSGENFGADSDAKSGVEQNVFDHVHQLLADKAYLTDQSDSFAVLDIQGPNVLPAMERVCTLDLENFSNAQVARTLMEHLSVIVEKPTDHGSGNSNSNGSNSNRFRLYSPRSSASSFLHAITTSLSLSH